MKVISLTIERKPSYDSQFPGQIIGLVSLEGDKGAISARLSNNLVSQIFELVRADCSRVAFKISEDVHQAVDDSAFEVLLTADVRDTEIL